ncbi:MAG: glycoside hydrolase family 43 protein [Defluviitaleaceae bacterium]|nr:glycoside hydrolase family 43 protein [Defluviitaleaceae bacterium]MCL2238919.1 glycoside hydrolase family 43 protein [Defluviitaleaceae bacterium]
MKILFVFVLFCLVLLAACGSGAYTSYEGEPLGEAQGADPAPEETPQPAPARATLTLTAPGAGFDFNDPGAPVFGEVSVHDPSVFRVGDVWYVIGSHMSAARTRDLIYWEQFAEYVSEANPLMYSVADFAEAFAWARTDTFWAGDVQLMPCGRFFMYYCNCEGSMPLGNIGLAIADHPEGPYLNQGIFLRSGMHGTSEDGTPFNANIHPNAVDPHAFFCSNGEFWMVYGSFSGGIFILRMCPETGFPLPGQGYGTRLMGNNHSRIEGPYILHSPHTGYYYLFITFGGLGREDGYNMRVARGLRPYGPFYDARGNAMIHVHGAPGSFFDDRAIEPYGTKLMGGYWFRREAGEPGQTTGYLSPGHNSAYFDAETGRYFLIFHTRFMVGPQHRVRVHEMFLTDCGWFVVSPFRFDGAPQRSFLPEHVPGSWKLINHGQDINYIAIRSETVNLTADGRVYGAKDGYWSLEADGTTFNITVDGVAYRGRLLRSYASDHGRWVMSFTAMSAEGIALWGAGVALD